MCELISEGGKRCASHTRPPFDAIMSELRAVPVSARNTIRLARSGEETAMMAAIAHASTKSGLKDVEAGIEEFKAGRDQQTQMWLTTARKNGIAQAEMADSIRKEFKSKQMKAERAKTSWGADLKVRDKATAEDNTAVTNPLVAAMWHPEDNQGISAEQTTQGQNVFVMLRCENDHPPFRVRLNNVTKTERNHGRRPACPQCKGRRQRGLQAMQGSLRDFAASMNNDQAAWEQLTPATRMAIMERAGMLSMQRTEFERATAMAMVHGDLTLEEVLAAKNADVIEGMVDEGAADADPTDTEVDLTKITVPDWKPDSVDQQTRIGRIMSSAGAARFAGGDEELISQIVRENTEAAWNEVHNDPASVERIVAQMRDAAGDDPYRQRVAREFEDELRRVQATPLPEGYQPTRRRGNGTVEDVDPLLSQRRFALRAQEDRRLFNWSGTGAGKTLSAVLATRASESQETLVVCPAGLVADQWAAEYRQAFPDTEVRMGLPRAKDNLEPREGRRRVWVATHGDFSQKADRVEAATDGLSRGVGAIVIDEVHMAKSSDNAAASLRSENLRAFVDKAGKANSDLMVVGQTATPVVNDLSEAKSIIRTVTGEDPKFGTAPTVKNATDCYRSISSLGPRWIPAYKPRLDKPEVAVDITDNLPRVMTRLKAIQKEKGGPVNASMMERALLPEKLPAITAAVRASNKPTIVYSEFTEGMVDPVVDHLRTQGITAKRFTGKESDSDRAALVSQFQSGEIRVIVGSSPIATGVDGLQLVSHNAVVVSAPWTATKDDQFVGRLYRTGQTEDVTVSYIRTEAKAGNLTWSWDASRFARIHFKRGLANAAVDGIIPDGKLESGDKATAKMLTGLQSLTDELLNVSDYAA